MYVHKYSSDGDTFYRISKGSGKPAGPVTLSSSEWHGKVSEHSGNVGRAISFLKDAAWSVKEVEEEKKEEKGKKASMAESLRALANKITGR